MPQRRRRVRSARTYTIAYLLSLQPKGLRKHDHYATMKMHFNASARLKALRIGRRCYSLLNRGRIAPHNLHHFYRTYRLPANPFFPLFFTIKRDYLAERERIKEERHRYIVSKMRGLPDPIRTTIKYLGYLERHYNAAGQSPLWQQHLFPGSKRKADEYCRNDTAGWLALFRKHIVLLTRRYSRLTGLLANRVLASFVLELRPNLIPPGRPSHNDISRSYRRLSLIHHPDRGGDPAMFIEIKKARDALAGSN